MCAVTGHVSVVKKVVHMHDALGRRCVLMIESRFIAGPESGTLDTRVEPIEDADRHLLRSTQPKSLLFLYVSDKAK